MESSVLTLAFASILLASTGTKLWLTTRQMRHVAAHRLSLPSAFAETVSLVAHQKAANYTLIKGRFSVLATVFSAVVLVAWTLLGGLDLLNTSIRDAVQPSLGPLPYQVALVAAFTYLGSALELPFDLYSTFHIEQRFGFNRTTWKLYLIDMARNTFLTLGLGLPIAALVLWIMGTTGSWWWLWAWSAWMVINLGGSVIYPAIISPLYNSFKPLEDESLKNRVKALMHRCGFKAKGIFVMDGSKRSTHGNAYFTGLGASKRVVFFDTLLESLTPDEVEAVLAHELGHFKHKHLLRRLLVIALVSLTGLALLGWLADQPWFYAGLGTQPSMAVPNDALALLLFLLVVPPFGFFLSPIFAKISRDHEFQADAFACRQTSGKYLATALSKLYEDNASTLTPDPLYVRFHYSHPAASERIAALGNPLAKAT